MLIRIFCVIAVMLTFLPAAFADLIKVDNGSFDILPSGAALNGCGSGCYYTVYDVPGWNGTGGQFRPGTDMGTYTYFRSLSDNDPTSAYSNGGVLSQMVGVVHSGVMYTLTVDLGWRSDKNAFLSQASLYVNGTHHFAYGHIPIQGNWSTFKATYTGTPSDEGAGIEIHLISKGDQSNFDNVRLDSCPVPEPSTLSLLGIAMISLIGLRWRRSCRSISTRC